MKITPLLFLCFLCSCSIIGTTYNVTSKVGSVVMDERELQDDWNDTKINVALRTKFLQTKINYVMDVEITVFEGEVMLNGAIPSIEDIETIVEITWQQEGVSKVYNELRMEEPSPITQASHDAIVSSSVKTKLLATSGITSVNYKITVDNNKLYMMGIAKNQDELNAVMNIIRKTEGITGVVSHIRKSFSE